MSASSVRAALFRIFLGTIAVGIAARPLRVPAQENTPPAVAPDLSKATSTDLLRVYGELRELKGGDQQAITENVEWKRDAGTFKLVDGRLTFAAPVEGHIVAAVFQGQGTFELNPPTEIDRKQIARFAKAPKLSEGFREAVFFFTDDSWDSLQKLVKVQGGGDAAGATRALSAAQKTYSEKLNTWWENFSKGAFPMRNLSARMLADLTDPSSKGFFLAGVKSEHHDELFYSVSLNRDPVLMPGFATDEEVMVVHWKKGEVSEWWSGFHTAGEYARTPHPEHRTLLAHCRQEKIEAEIGKDNHLSAAAEMEFEVPGGTPRVLPLNLENVLRISSITDDTGKAVSFIQEDRKLDSDPWVILSEPAAADKVYKLKVTYKEDSTRESRVIHQLGSGLYQVEARESWYPSFGAFDDRTSFDLHFRSPKKFEFIATGRRVSAEKSGDWLETEWQSEIPYLVAGFNYGDFVEKTKSDANLTVAAYGGREVPDELKGITAAMDMAELGGGPGANNIAGRSGIAIGGFNTVANTQYAADMSFGAFKLFENYFGPLPFKTISITEQPVGFFGQSWPTLIYLPYLSLLDATTRNSLHLSETAEGREFFNVVAVHEMAHQWWGHMLGWKTYHDQWMSEGFADFSAALYILKSEPKKFKNFWDLKRKWLLENNRVGHRPNDVAPLWLNYQANAYLEERNSTILIYYKGAYVLEMLRAMMEDPRQQNPDAPFISMMRDFVSTYAGKSPSTEDFRRIVEKHFGTSMDWFFNQWVYGTEVPHYDFSYELKNNDKGQTVLHFKLTQSGVSDAFYVRVPIYAYFQGTPRRLGTLNIKGSSTMENDAVLPLRPDKVVLDDNHSILCTMKQ